jgi:hypothetical protein
MTLSRILTGTLDSSVLYDKPRTTTHGDPREMEPCVEVMKWLLSASVACLSKKLKP